MRKRGMASAIQLTPPMIAIIEDNRGDVELLLVALRENAVTTPVTVISDGARACDLIDAVDRGEAAPPSLFVLDLNLPRRSGLEVLERIRQSRACAAVPVIVLSSSSAEADRVEAIRAGANHFVSKPSSLEEFLSLGALFKSYL